MGVSRIPSWTSSFISAHLPALPSFRSPPQVGEGTGFSRRRGRGRRTRSLHLNDQNGLKYDQDRPFGCTNLRSAFDQIRALERNGYGRHGEYVCFDVHPFRTTKPEHWLAHLDNSRRTFLRLVEKVRSFNEKKARALIADRDYQALDQMVIEHLMGK